MNEFLVYVQLGFEHICDLNAYDHLLFIITLCAVYHYIEWKKVLILVTAFTIGHSLTLALSALDIIRVPSDLVELLIPITILITSLYNVSGVKENRDSKKSINFSYVIALFFGFIHGMGFANYFRSLLSAMESITFPLFSFNIGIEIGQLLIVVIFFAIYFALQKLINFEHRSWNIFVSGAGAGVSLILIIGILNT